MDGHGGSSAAKVEQALLIALGVFIATTPFAKVVASIAHSLCILLFLLLLLLRRDRVWMKGARTYYHIVLIYAVIISAAVVYSPDRTNGIHEAWRQVTRLLTSIMLISMVSSERLAKQYLGIFACGGTVLAVIGIYEAIVLNAFRPPSMWHPVHGANILLMTTIAALMLAAMNRPFRWASIMATLLMLYALYLTGTRGVWVAAILVILLFPFLLPGGTLWKKFSLAAAVLLSIAAFTQTPAFRQRSQEAIKDMQIYRQDGMSNPKTSVAERLDMWKASSYMFLDRPLLGVGTGGWRSGLEKVVRTGRVPETLLIYGNPHNMFIDALTTRGIIGLTALCVLIGYPVIHALRTRQMIARQFWFVLVVSTTVGFAVAGLTDTLVIIRGVFNAYLIPIGLSFAAFAVPRRSEESTSPLE
jgi:O-antigen ligase